MTHNRIYSIVVIRHVSGCQTKSAYISQEIVAVEATSKVPACLLATLVFNNFEHIPKQN